MNKHRREVVPVPPLDNSKPNSEYWAQRRIRVTPDPKGIAVAREVAQYEIGDATWAHVIVDAYLNPDAALEELRREQEED